MTAKDILSLRLTNQRLTGKKFTDPAEAVAWFGAMQAQDYQGAKWGVGQRVNDATDQTMEEAFNDGKILRTHVMRPTWHFVHPEDIGWMLALTKPRLDVVMRTYDKQLELDRALFDRTNTIIANALTGKFLMRSEIAEELKKHGITGDGRRIGHIVHRAEIDGIICSGPRRGKQFTYALIAERVKKAKKLSGDEALTELTRRYFQSHGPATLKDFIWWSGLTFADGKRALQILKNEIANEVVGEKIYWFFPATPSPVSDKAFLLPNYDEYGIAYKERETFFDPHYNALLNARGNATFQHLIVYKGHIIGTWKRVVSKKIITIQTKYFRTPSSTEKQATKSAGDEYETFLSHPVNVM